MRIRLASMLAVAAVCGMACRIDLVEPESRRCDEEHPCRDGQVCREGWCVAPGSSKDGGTDGGATDGGGCSDPRVGTSCSTGTGACAATGTYVCQGGQVKCAASTDAGSPEVCDGEDNDCNGPADDGLTPPACPLTQGVCASLVRTCQGASGWSSCNYGADYELQETRCDGLDNDCDGTVDEVTGCLYTIVGEGPPAYRDGKGDEARFARPTYLTADSAGNLYVADKENHAIRKIAPDGTVTTVAGNGKCGRVDGPVAESELCYPIDVEVASDGTLYVSDSGNHVIRRIAAGQVSTIAGNGTAGGADGPALAASFNAPQGIALLSTGDLLIADSGNHKIRRLTLNASPSVTTEAGDGANGADDGPRSTMSMSSPHDVVSDSGETLYVSERLGHRIRMIPPTGSSSIVAGSATGAAGSTEGIGTAARLFNPMQLFLDASANALYVADSTNNKIRIVPLNGSSTSTFIGSGAGGYVNGPSSSVRFSTPVGITRIGADFYVADLNHAIRKVAAGTTIVSDFAGGTEGAQYVDGAAATARLKSPKGLAMAPDGSIYWIEQFGHRLRKRTPDGQVVTLVGDQSGAGYTNGSFANAQFDNPRDVKLGPDGKLYIGESYNSVIRSVDLVNGKVETFAGDPVNAAQYGHVDSADLTAARFKVINSLAFGKDVSGNPVLYVGDHDNRVIRKILFPNGPVSTFAGTVGGGASPPSNAGQVTDGPPGTATFFDILGMAADEAGNLYVCDSTKVRHVAPDGTVTTLYPFNLKVWDVQLDGSDLVVAGLGTFYKVSAAGGSIPPPIFAARAGWRDGDSNFAGAGEIRSIVVTPDAYLATDNVAARIRRLWK